MPVRHVPEVHPLYPYGPFVFLGASAIASALIAPRLVRRLDAARQAKRGSRLGLSAEDLPPFRRSPTLAVAGLGGMLLGFWGLGTLLCWLALLFAGEGPLEPGAPLPGATIDLFVIAHMSPPLSKQVAQVMIERLSRGAEQARFEPNGAVEARLAQAAAIDPSADEAARRYLDHHFRTRAGKVALANPSPVACTTGFEAFADALHEAGVAQLAQACRNVRGDTGASAAFKIGDFRNASGPETEAILSRLPFAPASEPSCLAGGDAVPPKDEPLCRLLHAEVKKETRSEILPALELEPAYAKRWLAAMRVARGASLPAWARFTVAPQALLFTPAEAIRDEPIAIWLELEPNRIEKLTGQEVASIEASIGAHRSAFGNHSQAMLRCERALETGATLDGEDRSKLLQICAAVSLRAGELARARELLEEAPSEILSAALAYRDDGLLADALRDAFLHPDLFELRGPALAQALSTPAGAEAVAHGVAPWVLGDAASDAALGDWLREAFPTCTKCDFFDQLGMLLLRRDAAEALGDQAVLDDLEPILGRYRAVVETRPLPIVLLAGRAD